ncbi:MAG TPA: hypothetical protein VMT35_00595 [Ignavibacteriaceae bacterium]|nr:hypothetical protein [Ignavibacteriaceae bacterium]
MSKDNIYILDSDALIDFYNHFPAKFKKLQALSKNGLFKIPEGVFRELKRKSDKLRRLIERWENEFNIVISIKSNIQLVNEFGRIEITFGDEIKVGGKIYPGFWKSPAGRKAADGQLVTIGKVLPKHIVVSDDKAVSLACLLENVECIGWAEFARRIGINNQNQQGSLFDQSQN